MCPDPSCPCVGVECTQSEDAPLLGLPCRVEPKRLAKHPEDARPSSPAFALVLRKPDRDDAAEGDADLIKAHGFFCGSYTPKTLDSSRRCAFCSVGDFAQESSNGAVYGVLHTPFGGGLLALALVNRCENCRRWIKGWWPSIARWGHLVT